MIQDFVQCSRLRNCNPRAGKPERRKVRIDYSNMKNKIIKMPGLSRENVKVLSRVDTLKNQRKTWVQIVKVVAEEGFSRAGGKPYTVFSLATFYSHCKGANR